ncbi:MAG: xanthine dehydrogenase family protein molybdopterin-binding subunit [Hyphomicrobiales bacterium]|nr:xanthine dehydrogenase family protein molybdopterin-binding subunit [Hyphomicrobiales bacterium]
MSYRTLGQSCLRDEDERLITGAGQFTDDAHLEGETWLAVVRSPVAAATITVLDIGEAKAMPGVVAVLTQSDVEADGIGEIQPRTRYGRPGGRDMAETRYTLLAKDRVRHIGEPVAVVVAESRAEAEDAAEAVMVDYDILPAVCDAAKAVKPGAPALWPDAPDNIAFVFERGDRAAVEQAFAGADHVTRLDFRVTRASANPMESRAALALHDEKTGRSTLWVGTSQLHRLRHALADNIFGVDDKELHLVSPDIGGSFGMKSAASREVALTLWAARRLRRPVRWTATRSESFLSDYHARDNVSTIELALDEQGHFLALKLRTLVGLGAYVGPNSAGPPTNHVGSLAGVYRTPYIFAEVTGVLINAQPTAPYRGAGRPEAIYAIERVIDVAAAELGIDRFELRRRNLIQPDEMPFKTGLTFTYDSGDFPRSMKMAEEAADVAGFAARRAEAKTRGKLLGLGVANAIEIAGAPVNKPLGEFAETKFDADGNLTLFSGSREVGTGHATVFRQILGELLGLSAERIKIVQEDTDQVASGVGTFGSRTLLNAGAVFGKIADELIARGLALAAKHLEAGEADLEFSDSAFRVKGTDRAIGLHELAAKEQGAFDMALEAGADGPTFPNGCHVCEAEIDPETGAVAITRYTVVDDVGTVVNPILLKGQIHGGVVQGLGQALGERIVYEEETGQLLSGSFTDYPMPHADEVPMIEVKSNPVPAKTNALGIKGAGEAGTVGALPAVMSAVIDALSEYGIRHLDMPATPERVWRAIQDAKAK